MLTNGNTKLGTQIWNFNLPRLTCVRFRTPICERNCYAKNGNFRKPWVEKSMQKNLHQSLQRSFIREVVKQIDANGIKFVRLHASGDFYKKSYYNKWLKIARRRAEVKFVAYTRNIEIDLTKAPDNLKIYFSKEFSHDYKGKTYPDNPTAQQFAYTTKWDRVPRHMEKHPVAGRFCNSKCFKCKHCFSGVTDIVFTINLMWRRLEPREVPGLTLF